jgi:Amt family ammonium transporter
MILDLVRTKRATAVGAATGAVVGLVAITPAAGYIAPMSALVLGALAAFPSYFAIQWRSRTRLDDSLDVFAAHGIGGIAGALLTGVFASRVWGAPVDGLIYGSPALLGKQVVAIVAAGVYSALVTFVLLKVISLLDPLRRSRANQGIGMDVVQHGEEAYSRGEGAVLVHERRLAPRAEGEVKS